MSEAEKVCRKCGLPKPLSDYARSARFRDGLNPWCRSCRTATTRERRTNESTAERQYQQNLVIRLSNRVSLYKGTANRSLAVFQEALGLLGVNSPRDRASKEPRRVEGTAVVIEDQKPEGGNS